TTTAVRAMIAGTAVLAALAVRHGPARIGALTAIAALELLHAGWGAVQTVPAERVTRLPAVAAPRPAATAHGPRLRPRLQRLIGPTAFAGTACYPPNLPGFHHLEDACAYSTLPPARMEDFFTFIEPDHPPKPNVAFGGTGVGAFRDPASLRHPLCDLF